MKIVTRNSYLLVIFWFTIMPFFAFSQGLPPGWDYSPTPNTHIVSIPLTSNPNINGVLLQPGDYIGVFYVNTQGFFTCGGAVEWLGDQNTGLIAFGDDSFTPEKDGFSPNELMHYKVYSWGVLHEYPATVTCNSGLPSSCTNFTSNGLSGLASLNAVGFFATITAVPAEICIGSSSQLSVSVSGGNGNYSFLWSSLPAGFSSTLPNPIVTPIITTQYFLTINDGTGSISGDIIIVVVNNPTVNAGNNITICENQFAQLNGSATNANTINWTSSGDGIFSDPGLLNPVYNLGPNDILNESVNLTLQVSPVSPCTLNASSSLNLNIDYNPLVNVGSDLLICSNSLAQLNATATNFASILWSSNGDGTFNNSTVLNPVYSPGSNDILIESVEIAATVSPVQPCVVASSDFLVVEIQRLPQVSAGDDRLICETANVTLIGQAVNNSGLLWETMGDGVFDNPDQISTNYYPGNLDIVTGSVTISLTAFSIGPCTLPVSDQMVISIVSLPEVFAGIDAIICENGIHQVTGVSQNYDEVFWSSSGDGIFGNPNLLSTTYTPGFNDIIVGTVILKLTAFPEFPCDLAVEDETLLNIIRAPFANAGTDQIICEGENAELVGNALNSIGVQWSTDGDGTFSDPSLLSTIYFPGNIDITNGIAHLTLSALPQFPCSVNDEDTMLLDISKIPTANAGSDATIFSDEVFQLNGQAMNFSDIVWNTSGDGLFDNPGILNPVYTPGIQDTINTSVVLSLTALANFPCIQNTTDSLLLTINRITSVSQFDKLASLEIFPNPNAGSFKISKSFLFEDNFILQVLSVHGALIYEEKVGAEYDNEGFLLTVSVPDIKDGIYLLKVFNNYHIAEGKFIVLRD